VLSKLGGIKIFFVYVEQKCESKYFSTRHIISYETSTALVNWHFCHCYLSISNNRQVVVDDRGLDVLEVD
jgi:hypothetical protein